MRRLTAILALALLVPAPVHATSAEAEALAKAVAAVNTSASALKATTPAEQAAIMALVVGDIGDVGDYTPACQPLARYVLLMAGAWHAALVAMVAEEPADIRGNLLVSIALLIYYSNTQGYIPVVINDCSVGL